MLTITGCSRRRDYIAQYPSCIDLTCLQAQTSFLTGDTDGASAQVLITLRLDPGNNNAKELQTRVEAVQRLKNEGNTSFKANQWSESITRYSDALEVDMMVLYIGIMFCTDALRPMTVRLSKKGQKKAVAAFSELLYCPTEPPLTSR